MAPTLLGWHRELTCPSCASVFVVGIEDEGQTGEAICPNCGKRDLMTCAVDRVRRRSGAGREVPLRVSPAQAVGSGRLPFSRRASAGLRQTGGRPPGESIRIVRRRRLRQRSDRPQVAAGNPGDEDLDPRQPVSRPRTPTGFRAGSVPTWNVRGAACKAGGSNTTANLCTTSPTSQSARDRRLAGLQALGSGRGGYGPISDFTATTATSRASSTRSRISRMEARTAQSVSRSIPSRWHCGPDPIEFLVRIPVTKTWVDRADSKRSRVPLLRMVAIHSRKTDSWPRSVRLEAAVIDGRFQAAIDGRSCSIHTTTTIRLDDERSNESPVSIGVRGGSLEVSEIRVYRDIYYTGTLANTPASFSRHDGDCGPGSGRFLRAGRQQPGFERFAVLE